MCCVVCMCVCVCDVYVWCVYVCVVCICVFEREHGGWEGSMSEKGDWMRGRGGTVVKH